MLKVKMKVILTIILIVDNKNTFPLADKTCVIAVSI